MFNPVPKPLKREKKPRKPLKAKKKPSVKSKSKVPASFYTGVKKRDGLMFQHPGCGREGQATHHITFQSRGRNTPWIHDPRNGVRLCNEHHSLIHTGNLTMHWRLHWERWAIIRFGWLGGQPITMEEWKERNQFKWVSRCQGEIGKY